MKKLRSLGLNLLTVAGSLVFTLLALEIALRFFPVAWAPPIEPPTTANPIQRYAANTPFTWSLGWDFYHVVRGRSNAQGFLADYDYDSAAATPLIAVVGDSFIEALQVPFAQSLTGRLQAMLGNRGRAYAFAQSGAPLSQYVAYAHHACVNYHPERMIVNVVGNDFDESVVTHRLRDGFFHLYERPDKTFDYKLTPYHPPSLAERVFRNSSLALYLARNANLRSVVTWFLPNTAKAADSKTGRYVGMTEAAATPERVDEGYRVIDWFLDALPQQACLAPKDIVLTVDASRPQLYDPGALAATHASYFETMRRDLIAKARARGFLVLDLEPVFLAAYAKDGARFEFSTDGHWNAHGHEVVAAALRDILGGWPPQ
jgi:hypothetical protein